MMKIKKQSIENLTGGILLILLVIVLYKFFFLFDDKLSSVVKGAYGPSTKTLDIVAALLILASVLESRKVRRKCYFIEILISEFIILIAAIATAQSDFLDKWMSYWVLPLLYFSLTNWMKNERRIKLFLIAMQVSAVIANILLIAQATIVNTGGTYFLHIYFIESGYWYTYRNGLLRITENDVLYLMSFCVSVAQINGWAQNKKLINALAVVNIITTLINFFYIDQSRMIISVAIFVILFDLFVNKKLTKKQFLIRFAVVVCMSILVGTMWDKIVSVLHFSTKETSFTARAEGYGYFLGLGFQNPLHGVGFSSLLDSNGVNYTDVGIIGTLGQFGLILFMLYVVILVKMIQMSVRNQNRKSNIYKYVSANITFMTVLLSLTTMSMFNYGLLQVFAIALALLEALSNERHSDNISR